MRFNDIEKYINARLDQFNAIIPQLEGVLSNTILKQLTKLQLSSDGSVKRTAGNFKVMLAIQRQLNDALLDTTYKKSLADLFKSTGKISDLFDDFYKNSFDVSKPSTLTKAIREGSRSVIVDRMTTGLTSSLYETLQPILNNGVINGLEYNTLTDQIKQAVKGTSAEAGIVDKYAKQIATDTLNNYAGQYNTAMQAGLGFQWYRYAGSNIATTRDFCIACKMREYLHVSEFPKIIKGNFQEFKEIGGKIYNRYGLPQGVREGTNSDNFLIYRGGYNCGHQLRPVYEWQVPKSKRNEIYATTAYKAWKKTVSGELI